MEQAAARSGRRSRVGVVLRGFAVAGVVATVCSAGLAAATSASSGRPSVTAPDAAAAHVLSAARGHLGDRYVYGGTGPSTWDCSGLTSTMWRTAGGVAGIPRTAAEQQAWATPVPASQALPGDLVFFDRPATHVGLYEGGGWIIDASSSHQAVVERPLWTTDVTYGRVPRPTAPPVTGTPSPNPSPRPSPTPSPSQSPSPTPSPSPAPSTPAPAPGHHVRHPGMAMAAAAAGTVGATYAIDGTGPAYDDGALVSVLWKQITGVSLPTDRTALAAATRPVRPHHRVWQGDLVIYGGSSVWHVGIYVGNGMMIDASRSLGHVVLRPVLAVPDVRYGRLPRH